MDHDSWSDLPGESVQGVDCSDDPPDTDNTISQPCASRFATSQ